jgi:ferredoxin
MSAEYFISQDGWEKFLDALKEDYEVFVPVKKGERIFYQRYAELSGEMAVGEARPFEPLKSFFFPAREKVASGFSPGLPRSGEKPRAIVGVKACDLRGFKIQDYVFLDHDYRDPFYARAREENLIIAADCTAPLSTCFCLALDVKPFPGENFDLGLSEVAGGFTVTAASEKGAGLVGKNRELFEPATEGQIKEREEKRAAVISKVRENISREEVPHQDSLAGVIAKNYEADLWAEEAMTCVECGACNTICPTCHCFLLYDEKDGEKMARLRIWDSCLLKPFARVAGGANPRPHLRERLRNRFEKKFDFFPRVAEVYACTGCGRCIAACPGKIDIRRILKRLADENAG